MMVFKTAKQKRFVMGLLRRSNGNGSVVRIDREDMTAAVKEGTREGFDRLGQKVDGLAGKFDQLEEGITLEQRKDTDRLIEAIDKVTDAVKGKA